MHTIFHHIRKVRRLFAYMALAAFITGCTLPSAMQKASKLEASTSSVIIVGKIELNPPIDTKYEQKTHWNVLGDDAILNKIVMATGTDPAPVNTSITMSEWQNAIEAEQGKTFFLQTKRQRTHLKGAMITLDAINQDRIWLPGGLYFDVPKDTRAVYLGTLRYTRSDFNDIKKVEVIDEYKKTLAELKNRFGSNATMKRSLLKSNYPVLKMGQRAIL